MLTQKQIEFLSKEIKEGYGTPEQLARHLDAAIEMLFYLEEETFVRRDVQNVVTALRGISSALRK